MKAEAPKQSTQLRSGKVGLMGRQWSAWLKVGSPGAGILVAVFLLAGVEWILHSESFFHRLRSVFAVGRALDKVLYVERNPPGMLLLGNSRVDNGVDPRTLAAAMGTGTTAFNLGLPGANATTLLGIVERLDRLGRFGRGKIERVLIGLDEGIVQKGDALGYNVFFVDPPFNWTTLPSYFSSHFHLWGYAENLKQLREPAKFVQFYKALTESIEPVGGGASERLGYRPGFGAAQNIDQIVRQEAGSSAPPHDGSVESLFALIALLERRKVAVEVIFPPLLNRTVLYLDLEAGRGVAKPYREILKKLDARGVPMYALNQNTRFLPLEFINAGHLNDSGAQRFSAMLGAALVDGGGVHLRKVLSQ